MSKEPLSENKEGIECPFFFSVVITVYNTEKYLKEAVDSIIGQSIGFEENIQLVLVNNATEDNSASICEQYANKYPRNVVYLNLDRNRGISGGRNAAIPYLKGRFVTFMDSDDKWEQDAFEAVYDFYQNATQPIKVLCCREKCFDAWDSWHIYDYIYNESRVLDVLEDYSCTIFAAHASFIDRSLFKEHQFDETVTSCEDMIFMTEIILECRVFAVIREAVYDYRQRSAGNSQVQSMVHRKEWFLSDFETTVKKIKEASIRIYGTIIPYVQFIIMSNLQGRVKIKIGSVLTAEEYENYVQLVMDALSVVDNDIISSQRLLSREQMNWLLQQKTGRDVYEESAYRNGKLFFDNMPIYSFNDKNRLSIDILEIRSGQLEITGLVNLVIPENEYKLVVRTKSYETELKMESASKDNTVCLLDKEILNRKIFHLSIPLEDAENVSFVLYYGIHKIKLAFKLGKFSHISELLKNAFYYKNGYMVTTDGRNIFVRRVDKKQHKKAERKLCFELFRTLKLKALFCRTCAKFVARLYKKKRIWLVTDRILTANDCGEFFFQYVMTHKEPDIKCFFVLSKESDAWKRLKKYGPVVNYRSWKHRFLYLCATDMISSLTNEWVLNPIPYSEPYLRDMMDCNFIHIQHGIIKDDISSGIGCLKKNMRLLITSAEREKQSILDCPYGYDESVVKVLGLPRLDCTIDESVKCNLLLIAPTWRSNLTGENDRKHDTYFYNPKFKNSEFFKFYNKLINDTRILESLSSHGMKAALRLHPMFQMQSCDFKENEVFQIQSGYIPYREDMSQTACLVTDYSSAAFDYAYYYRPIVYTQFDKESFYGHHTYSEGYFKYDSDGFGPVCEDYETTVQAILSVIENGCDMEKKYKDRVDAFFAYRDGNNCQRIYQEILKIDAES